MVGSTKSEQKNSHEYLSKYYWAPHVYITKGKDQYESFKLDKKKVNGYYDSREVFKLFEKFENEGYALTESNVFSTRGDYTNSRTYFLLKKWMIYNNW